MTKVSSMFTNVNPIIKSHKITIDYLIYKEQVWLGIIIKISIVEKDHFPDLAKFRTDRFSSNFLGVTQAPPFLYGGASKAPPIINIWGKYFPPTIHIYFLEIHKIQIIQFSSFINLI
jgi:hypothetical protein